jgi:hypothetical protein
MKATDEQPFIMGVQIGHGLVPSAQPPSSVIIPAFAGALFAHLA